MEVEVKEGTAPLAVDEDLPDDIEMAEDALLHTPSSGPDQGKNGSIALSSATACALLAIAFKNHVVFMSCHSIQQNLTELIIQIAFHSAFSGFGR